MKNAKTLRRIIFLTTILVLTSVIAAGIYTQASRPQKRQKDYGRTYEAAKVTTAPEVKSNIEGLEISGVTLINQGAPEASIAIDVTNTRDQSVMALDFISGKSDRSGIRIDGLWEEGNPRVIIPPHSLETFTWGLGEIIEGTTVSLAAAVFADGKEEGDNRSLNSIKITRAKHQKKQREEKAKNGGQQ
jgi:hypothetical protein